MRRDELAAWVHASDATALLPSRHSGEAGRIALPFTLSDATELGAGLSLAVVRDAEGRHYPVPLAVTGPGWRRATSGDGAALALVGLLGDGGDTRRGRFEATRWHGPPLPGAAAERPVDVDQTNESVVVDERVVVKWTVRSAGGPEAAPSRLADLVESGFTGMPRPWGLVRWHPEQTGRDAEPVLVATAVDYLRGAVDGWEWVVEDVRALARGDLDLTGAAAPAAALGALTAQMHLGLPTRGRAGPQDTARWVRSARAELADALAVVDGGEGARLRAHAGDLAQLVDRLGTAVDTPLIDTHGDLHVGQVLRWQPSGPQDDADPARMPDGPAYAVTDFDGNPVLSPAERVAPAPAAVDVAGLLQSLDHVGRVVVHRTDGVGPDVVEEWIAAAQSALLVAYRRELAAADRSELLDHLLLRPLRARQVVREYLYAVRHLPHWRYVPHAALPSLFAPSNAKR